jgi:hypothetical protein
MAEESADSATISFIRENPSVIPIFYNDERLPKPEAGTMWDPVSFPAGLPFEITVHVYYHQPSSTYYYNPYIGLLGILVVGIVETAITATRSVDTDVLFLCPPLETGKNYALSFRKEAGIPGTNKLILIDTETNKIVHQQVFRTS